MKRKNLLSRVGLYLFILLLLSINAANPTMEWDIPIEARQFTEKRRILFPHAMDNNTIYFRSVDNQNKQRGGEIMEHQAEIMEFLQEKNKREGVNYSEPTVQ